MFIIYVASNIRATNNHILMMIVTDLNAPGDNHLVDVGNATPCFIPIPLNFEVESPIYTQSFLQYINIYPSRWETGAVQ